MVQALQKQLEILAIDSAENFSQRICKRLGKRQPQGLEAELRDFSMLFSRIKKKICAGLFTEKTFSKKALDEKGV